MYHRSYPKIPKNKHAFSTQCSLALSFRGSAFGWTLLPTSIEQHRLFCSIVFLNPTTKIRLVSSYETLRTVAVGPSHVASHISQYHRLSQFRAKTAPRSWGIWILLPSFGPTHYPPMNLWEIFNTLQVSALESWYLRLVGLAGGIESLNFAGWYATKLVLSLLKNVEILHFWHHDFQSSLLTPCLQFSKDCCHIITC